MGVSLDAQVASGLGGKGGEDISGYRYNKSAQCIRGNARFPFMSMEGCEGHRQMFLETHLGRALNAGLRHLDCIGLVIGVVEGLARQS